MKHTQRLSVLLLFAVSLAISGPTNASPTNTPPTNTPPTITPPTNVSPTNGSPTNAPPTNTPPTNTPPTTNAQPTNVPPTNAQPTTPPTTVPPTSVGRNSIKNVTTSGLSKPKETNIFGIVLLVGVLMVSFVINNVAHGNRILGLFPEGTLTILIGTLVGMGDYLAGDVVTNYIAFDTHLFQLYLLPPIIFDAGFSLKKKGLFDNLGTILLFAVFGTLVSTVLMGAIVFWYIEYQEAGSADVLECGMFGALISAVDPIASLAVFSSVFKIDNDSRQGQNPLLYNLVFGESVLNDAVSIVIYKTFESNYVKADHSKHTLTATSAFNLVGIFLYVSVCSLLIGIGIGVLNALLFKYTNNKASNITYEIFMIFFFSYSSFVLAEAFHLSGIVAIFFCGIVQSHYTWYNLSSAGCIILPKIYHSLAVVMETLIFAYLGMSVFVTVLPHMWDGVLVAITLAGCLVARALSTVIFSNCANLKRKRIIGWRKQIIIWFSGLRGAIAFALAIDMYQIEIDGSSITGTPYAAQFMSTTLAIVMITTFIMGGLTQPLLEVLKLNKEDEQVNIPKSQKPANQKSLKFKLNHRWRKFDKKYLKQWFCLPTKEVTVILKRMQTGAPLGEQPIHEPGVFTDKESGILAHSLLDHLVFSQPHRRSSISQQATQAIYVQRLEQHDNNEASDEDTGEEAEEQELDL